MQYKSCEVSPPLSSQRGFYSIRIITTGLKTRRRCLCRENDYNSSPWRTRDEKNIALGFLQYTYIAILTIQIGLRTTIVVCIDFQISTERNGSPTYDTVEDDDLADNFEFDLLLLFFIQKRFILSTKSIYITIFLMSVILIQNTFESHQPWFGRANVVHKMDTPFTIFFFPLPFTIFFFPLKIAIVHFLVCFRSIRLNEKNQNVFINP